MPVNNLQIIVEFISENFQSIDYQYEKKFVKHLTNAELCCIFAMDN